MTNSNATGSKTASPDVDALREALAQLEHEQWCAWSRTVAEAETLSAERLDSWTKRWVAYSELSEADKDLDRTYADRVLALLAGLKLVTLPPEPEVGQGE